MPADACPAGVTTYCPAGATIGKLGQTNVAHDPLGLKCSPLGRGVQSVSRGSTVCDVGGLTVDWRNANADFEAESGWRILSGEAWREDRSWREDQKKTEEVMIQSLMKNPTTTCVDTGAGLSKLIKRIKSGTCIRQLGDKI